MERTAPTEASRTCLVIDDDPDFAGLLRRGAEGIGLQARTLTDATLLEQSLAAGDPDVITLDMDMPVRNGLVVLEELVARGLDKRVIIISGTPPDHIGSTRPRVGKAQVAAVLTKPTRKRDIEMALRLAIHEDQTESSAFTVVRQGTSQLSKQRQERSAIGGEPDRSETRSNGSV